MDHVKGYRRYLRANGGIYTMAVVVALDPPIEIPLTVEIIEEDNDTEA